jgi:NitT/TauT family transport system ATP-binding protein
VTATGPVEGKTAEPEGVDASPTVELHGVVKRFGRRGRGLTALDGVDLAIGRGEFVSIVGPSGCGKSTLLRVVGGLLDADGGTVTIGGNTSAGARKGKQFGLVPQDPALLPWRTVRQNVRLLTEVNKGAETHAALRPDETADLLTEVGLGDFLDAYPGELSGGMQQRVSLVRAFALGAPILLMDEPFAALDEMTREDMRFLLLRLWERSGTTVLFVTHHIPEAVVLSDRVLVMSQRPGRIVADEHIGLARPRTVEQEETAAFLGHVKRVRLALQQGAAA